MVKWLCMLWLVGSSLHAQKTLVFGDHPYDHARMVNRYGDQVIRQLNQLFTMFGQASEQEQEKVVLECIQQFDLALPEVKRLTPYRGKDGKGPVDSTMTASMRQFFTAMEWQVVPGLKKISGKMFKFPPVQTQVNQLPQSQQEVYQTVVEMNTAVRNATEVLTQAQKRFNETHAAAYNTYPCEKLMYLMARIEAGNPDTVSRFFDAPPQKENVAGNLRKMVYMFGFGPVEAKPQVKPQFDAMIGALNTCLDERWTLSRRELVTGHAYLLHQIGKGWGNPGCSVWIALAEARPGAGLQYRVDILY
jgi:hypothetical protein